MNIVVKKNNWITQAEDGKEYSLLFLALIIVTDLGVPGTGVS